MPFGGMFGYLGDYVVLWLMLISLIVHTWCFFRFFPKASRPRIRLILGNLLVLLCLLGTAAMVGESYLRFLCVRTDSFGVSLPARKWFALYTRLNSAGCRDVEWARSKPPGVRRIAFVGDSFTYGWGIEKPEDRFTDLIRSRLDREYPKQFEVLNVAYPGWGTGDQLEPVVDMIERYALDEVVLCYVFNDIEKLLPKDGNFDPTRPPQPKWFNPDSSALADWLFRTIVLPRVPSVRNYQDWLADGYADNATWGQHQQQLLAIRNACADRGVEFRVAILPYLRTSSTKFDRERLHNQLRHFLNEERIEAVDLLSSVAGRDARNLVVSQTDAHPNHAANQLFAESIWKEFLAGSK